MPKLYANYNTEEVLRAEASALVEKLGSVEKAKEAIDQWMKSEAETLDKIDSKDIIDRLEHTIETKGGDIWVCMKVYNINNLQKMFGTEPEKEQEETKEES